MERFRPEGEPTPLPELMMQLEEFDFQTYADPETAGRLAAGNIAKEWKGVSSDPNAKFDELAYIKAVLTKKDNSGLYR